MAKLEVVRRLDMRRVAGMEAEVKAEVERSMIWWHQRDGVLENNPSNMLFGPKKWGRRPDFLSARGWGHWDGEEWVTSIHKEEEEDVSMEGGSTINKISSSQHVWEDIHSSYKWSQKLEENKSFDLPYSTSKYRQRK